jgi:outer membrane biosynthesis protein TonB
MQDVLEVTVEWCGTVVDVQHLADGERFELNSNSPYGGLDDLLPPGGLALAEVSIAGFRVTLPPGIGGAWQGAETRSLSVETAHALTLAQGDRARCSLGPLTFYFARVPASVAPKGRSLLSLMGDVRSLGSAAILHAVVMLIAIAMPPTKKALSVDRFIGDDRYVDVLMVPPDQLQPLFAGLTDTTAETGDEQGDSQQTEVAPPQSKPVQMTRPTPTKPVRSREDRKQEAIAVANDVMDALGDGALGDGDLLGGGDPLGAAGMAALAGMNGDAQGSGEGLGGPGSPFGGTGLGMMPGGRDKSLKTGRVRTGCKNCRTVKTALGSRQTKKPRKIRIISKKPVVSDGLSRDEVMRVIRTKRNQYRACYEKALQTRRGLEGKIRMAFIVGPSGKVLSAKADQNTMGSPEVAQCISRRMRNWYFPRPRGGGIVKVSYPFIFRSGA